MRAANFNNSFILASVFYDIPMCYLQPCNNIFLLAYL